MRRRIMDRSPIRRMITICLICWLVLMMPSSSEADKITRTTTTDALREASTASSLPLSNSAITAILNAGTPVSETSTSTFSDGTTQTAILAIVPNTSAGTVMTIKDINLADGEAEKVVDVASIVGNTTTYAVTTTLPDGSVQTKDETDVTTGDKTIIKGTVSVPGARTQTITGETVVRGSTSVTDETITNAAGRVYHDCIVVTHTGDLSQSETNTTLGPGGSITTVKSSTSTVLNPNEVAQRVAQANLSVPAPTGTVQALNLQAQVLTSPSGISGVEPAPLPIPLPEPSTLTLICVVLCGIGLRRRWTSLTSSRSRREFMCRRQLHVVPQSAECRRMTNR
jgi:PEP-CTERM motif